MIPKIIYTIWLSEVETPLLVKRCVETHKLPGYEHRMITLDNCFKDHKYVQDGLRARRWGKVCDYLRCHYLIETGGIYLDADIEILPGKNFDHLLNRDIFAAVEFNRWISTAAMGAEKGNLLLTDLLKETVLKFKGDDIFYFESSLELFTPRMYAHGKALPSEYFYPYNHCNGTVDITDKTICYHHYMKTWP